MHKCHNYHAILHKLYTWFGKNELRLYLNRAKKIRLAGGAAPAALPLNTPMGLRVAPRVEGVRGITLGKF